MAPAKKQFKGIHFDAKLHGINAMLHIAQTKNDSISKAFISGTKIKVKLQPKERD